MDDNRVRLILYWGGEIINGPNGPQYDGQPRRFLNIDSEIRLSCLLGLLHQVTGIDGMRFKIKLRCRYPLYVTSQSITYINVPVDDDDNLRDMLSIPKHFPSVHVVELYIVQEPLSDRDERGESGSFDPSANFSSFSQLLSERIDNRHIGQFISTNTTLSIMPNNRQDQHYSGEGPHKNMDDAESSRAGETSYTGPRVYDLLTLQDTHRSVTVWEDPDCEPLEIRRSESCFWSSCPLDIRIELILHQVGFYGVYKAGHIQVDHALITALVERWRQETHTFHLPIGEATITLQDIGVLWGLPIDGDAVIGREFQLSVVEWQDICRDLLGFMPDIIHFHGQQLKYDCISSYLDQHPLTPESTEHDVWQHARGRILQMIGCIMGDKSGSKVKLMYLLLLRDLTTASNFSWGSATLASLYRALCRASRVGTKQITGPLPILQLWAWERIPKIRPGVHIKDNFPLIGPNLPTGPRACRWATPRSYTAVGSVGSHVLRSFRDQLDLLLEGDFVWQPYLNDCLQQLPDYCVQGREVWTAIVPLINFDVVELHCPDRVMRQFGYEQNIPGLIDTSVQLHAIDRRGRGGCNWPLYHKYYLERWAGRRENIVIGMPIVDRMDFSSDYMRWYRQVTRILVGNPTHRPTHGFHSSASIVEYWGQCLGQLHHLALEAKENVECDREAFVTSVRDITAKALRVVGKDRRMLIQDSNFAFARTERERAQSQSFTSRTFGLENEELGDETFSNHSFQHQTSNHDEEIFERQSPPHVHNPISLTSPPPEISRRVRRRAQSRQQTFDAIPFNLDSAEPIPPRRQSRRNVRRPPCGT